MKTLKLIVTTICISLLAFFLLGAECGAPVESVNHIDSLPTYFIIFKLNGESKTFDRGFTDFESKPFGNKQSSTKTTLIATPDDETGMEEPDNYIWIDFNGADVDTYPTTFLNVDIDLDLSIEGGATVNNSNIVVQVTSYGAVGETITGYFYGTLSDGSIITEGVFKVYRAPDYTFPPIS